MLPSLTLTLPEATKEQVGLLFTPFSLKYKAEQQHVNVYANACLEEIHVSARQAATHRVCTASAAFDHWAQAWHIYCTKSTLAGTPHLNRHHNISNEHKGVFD